MYEFALHFSLLTQWQNQGNDRPLCGVQTSSTAAGLGAQTAITARNDMKNSPQRYRPASPRAVKDTFGRTKPIGFTGPIRLTWYSEGVT